MSKTRWNGDHGAGLQTSKADRLKITYKVFQFLSLLSPISLFIFKPLSWTLFIILALGFLSLSIAFYISYRWELRRCGGEDFLEEIRPKGAKIPPPKRLDLSYEDRHKYYGLLKKRTYIKYKNKEPFDLRFCVFHITEAESLRCFTYRYDKGREQLVPSPCPEGHEFPQERTPWTDIPKGMLLFYKLCQKKKRVPARCEILGRIHEVRDEDLKGTTIKHLNKELRLRDIPMEDFWEYFSKDFRMSLYGKDFPRGKGDLEKLVTKLNGCSYYWLGNYVPPGDFNFEDLGEHEYKFENYDLEELLIEVERFIKKEGLWKCLP